MRRDPLPRAYLEDVDGQQRIIVELRYSDEDERAVIKALGGRWNSFYRVWNLPANLDVYRQLTKRCPRINIVPSLARAAEAWEREHPLRELELELRRLVHANLDAVAPLAIPGLRGQLYPYQAAGVRWIEVCGGRALIGDEMGLGKTVQALAWLQLHPELRPALILCPAIMRGTWAAEARRWLEPRPENDVVVVRGERDVYDALWHRGVVVVSYDLAHRLVVDDYHFRFTGLRRPRVVVLDECQYIKTPNARRTQSAITLARSADAVIALSGTPMLNRPRELFTVLNLLLPDMFPRRREFEKRYCGGHYEHIGGRDVWVANGATNVDELAEKLRYVMIRRRKSDVLAQLPPQVHSLVEIEASELDNAREYNLAERDFRRWLVQHKLERSQVLPGSSQPRPADIEEGVWRALQAEALVRLTALRRLVGVGKIGCAVAWAREFLDASDEKLVVFAYHREVHEAIYQALQNDYGAVLIAPGTDYTEAVRRFQEDHDVRVAVCSLRAGSTGVTLTAASHMLLVELDWTPAQLEQAEARIHRIGQPRPCTYRYLVVRGTVDDDMLSTLELKRSVINSITAAVPYSAPSPHCRSELAAAVHALLSRYGCGPDSPDVQRLLTRCGLEWVVDAEAEVTV